MFHLEGIIFIAVLCAVNASVIVNVYDDDIQTTTTQDLKNCDLRECEQLCRRIGFPGGACVNNRCKCDIIDSSELEENDILVDQSLRECNDQECDQLCRRLGFPGGLCVGDSCTCRSSLRVKGLRLGEPPCFEHRCPCGMEVDSFGLHGLSCDKSSESKKNYIDQNIRKCNNQACDQLCRRMGYTGGVCVGDRCSCDIFLQSTLHSELEENDTEENNTEQSVRECNNQACDQLCRIMGFPGGVCVGNRCSCNSSLRHKVGKISIEENDQENDINYNYISKKTSKNMDICSTAACQFACQDINYPGGKCDKGKCTCVSQVTNTLRTCDEITCNITCGETGHLGGQCINDQCWCF